jgi:aquaporin Z
MVVIAGIASAPLAIGSMLMVMVYMGGHVSGAHYNPAVTIAAWLRGALPKGDVLPYVAAQVFGAWLAASAVNLITGRTFAPGPGADYGLGAVMLAEILVTFALVLVVLHVATTPDTKGNSYFGLAIGFTVAAGAFAVGGVSGGAFNPAVGIGPILVDTLMGSGSIGNLWIYIVAPVLGGLAAVPVFKLQTRSTGT